MTFNTRRTSNLHLTSQFTLPTLQRDTLYEDEARGEKPSVNEKSA